MRGIPTPVINVPGCPPHPDWMVGTLALLLDAMKRKGTEGGVLEIMRGLDDVGRPKVFYPNTHLTCPYLSSFEDGIFSPFMTDKKGCRFELGCRGPWSGCGGKSPPMGKSSPSWSGIGRPPWPAPSS